VRVPAVAVDYLLEDRQREQACVLRGNLNMCAS
jgi:hypothetical protein